MKKITCLLVCLLLVGFCTHANATDVTSMYLTNSSFDIESDYVSVGIVTYAKNMSTNGTAYCHQADVTGWTISTDQSDGCAGGTFQVGGGVWLATSEYVAPSTNSNGENTGGMLGLSACWGDTVKYTCDVTLPAGTYAFSYIIYNTAGTSAIEKNYFGFIADDGTEYLDNTTTFATGSWKTISCTFKLTEETSGKISLGYLSSSTTGSVNCPHLFVDKVKLSNTYFEEGTYYLYNEATQSFMERGADWGTHLTIGKYGYPINISLSDDLYTLKMVGITTNDCIGFDTEVYSDVSGDNARTYTSLQTDSGYVFTNNNGYVLTIQDSLVVGILGGTGSAWQLKTQTERDSIIAARVANETKAAYESAGLTYGDAYDMFDVTNTVSSPTLCNSIEGWTLYKGERGETTTGITESGTEVYQGATGSLSQTVTGLPAGLYKVSVNAMFRDGSNADQVTFANSGYYNGNAYLSANGNQVQITPWAKDRTSDATPNDMSAFSSVVENDPTKYLSEVYAYVSDEGILNISMAFPAYNPSCWFIAKNVKLARVLDTSSSTSGDFDGDDCTLSWSLNKEGILTISGTGAMPSSISDASDLPWNSYLDKVKMVIIEDGVTTISPYAFQDCENLTMAVVPTDITTIGAYAFSGTALSHFTFPTTLNSIGKYAFYGTKLESVNIDCPITTIGISTFQKCASLKTVTLPATITSIGNNAFKDCPSLTTFNCKAADVPTTSTLAFTNTPISTATLTIPTTSIALYQAATPWSGFGGFAKIILGTGSVGENITWTVTDDGTLTLSGSGSTYWYNTGTSGRVIPYYSLKDIITSIVVEENITILDNAVFNNLTMVTTASLPSTLTVIDEYAFYNCSSLSETNLPQNVTTIGNYAFWNSSLTTVTLPQALTSMGTNVFGNSNLHTVITYNKTPCTINYQSASILPDDITLYVMPYSSNTVSAYKASTYWNLMFSGRIEEIQPIEKTNYYIKNVATGKYLTAGAWWGTAAILEDEPYYEVSLEKYEKDGDYLINTHSTSSGGQYLFYYEPDDRIYVDNHYNHTWRLDTIDVDNHIVNIVSTSHEGKYLTYDETDTEYHQLLLRETPCEWQLVTKDELLADLDGATIFRPKDATFLITGSKFLYNDGKRNLSWDGSNPTGISGRTPTEDNQLNCSVNAEFFNTNFDMSRTLTGLPAGKYRVDVQGFYRYGGSPQQYLPCYVKLFANADSVLIHSLTDEEEFTDSALYEGSILPDVYFEGCGYVPNGQIGASYRFDLGMYNNSITTTVTDGTLTLGLCKTTLIENDWCCFDNFKLTYLGPEIDITNYDITRDGKVNTNDVNALRRAILGYTTTGWNTAAMDVNGDGVVSISDISALIYLLLMQ